MESLSEDESSLASALLSCRGGGAVEESSSSDDELLKRRRLLLPASFRFKARGACSSDEDEAELRSYAMVQDTSCKKVSQSRESIRRKERAFMVFE